METKVTVFEPGQLFSLRAGQREKIEAISNAIGALEKDGYNSHGRFKFLTHEGMTTALRPLLLKHSLSIVMDVVDVNERDIKNSNGKLTIRTTVKALFTITDTESGYESKHTFFGASQDLSGKSLQQAISQCAKYFYFKNFKVTDKEADDDYNSSEIIQNNAPPPPPKHTLAGLQSLLNQCKTDKQIYDLWGSIDKKLIPAGFQEACAARKQKINKVDTYKQPSTDGKQEYTQAFSIVNGWSCSCKSTSNNCKHIKLSKVIS